MNDDYSEAEFPWCFYFNGELMPKWGACWGLAGIPSFLQVPGHVGHEAAWDIYCSIDHVGAVESADPDVFIYAAQEVLCILLSYPEPVFSALSRQTYGEPQEIYSSLVEAALRMRESVVKNHCAFWTSGNESDQGRLIGVMRRCQIPSTSSTDNLPPHVVRDRDEWRARNEDQVRRLHQLAQAGLVDKDLRKRLHEIRAA